MLGRILLALLVLAGLAAIALAATYYALRRPDLPYETLAARYETAASRYLDLPGGISMHYQDVGPANAPTVLLVHGFSASLHTWTQWREQLAGEYRVVAIDLPGHGLTRAPAGYQASVEAFRDATLAFADAHGLGRFTIVGSSMGGNVAWEFALAHPERIDALVLVDASGWEDTRADVAEEPAIFKLLRNPVAGPFLRDLDNTALIRQGLEASFANTALVDDAMVARYRDLARAPGHRDILLQITLGFRERHYATPERLAALTAPTLILQGELDALVPPEHARQFHDAIAGARLVALPDVGHIPQEEIPEQSAAALRDFLRGVYADSAPAAAAQ